MFQAHTTAAPAVPSTLADLAALGFHFTPTGTLLSTSTGTPYNFHQTNSEHANHLHKELIQRAVCTHVVDVVRKQDNIHEHYLTADREIHKDKPKEAHVPILMTEMSELAKKRDVIIFIGESGQEMGIWAWRMMRDDGFLSKGTAVGLAEEMKGWGATLESFGEVEHADYAGFEIEVEEVKGDPTPGLIILNPSELCYSPYLNRAMTHSSWTRRPQSAHSTLSVPIDPASNRVPGHTDASQHIQTSITHILPKLLHPTVRTYIICQSDCVPDLLTHLNDDMVKNGRVMKSNEAIALIQPPIFDACQILTANDIPTHMAARARAWVDSREPFGELVCVPSMDRPDFAAKPRAEWTEEDDVESQKQLMNGEGEREGEANGLPKLPVCCPHFSSGKSDGVEEIVWPRVMGRVMAWFWDVREEVVKGEGLSRGVESARQKREDGMVKKGVEAKI